VLIRANHVAHLSCFYLQTKPTRTVAVKAMGFYPMRDQNTPHLRIKSAPSERLSCRIAPSGLAVLAIVQKRLAQTPQDFGAGFEQSLKPWLNHAFDVFAHMIDQGGDLLLKVGRVDRGVRRRFIGGCFHTVKGQILAWLRQVDSAHWTRAPGGRFHGSAATGHISRG
jgi:hypothetical protein